MPSPRVLLVGAPAFLIALLGLAHPIFLTPDTADRWQLVHLAFLPAFPLLAASLLYLLRRDTGVLAWAGRVAAFAYAVLYGALDAIAGIGAPEQVRNVGAKAPIGDLYSVGDQLGHLGVYALALSAALTALLVWQRSRSALAPVAGALALFCCVFFYRHHVFPPRGVLALVGIGVALVLLAVADVSRPAASAVDRDAAAQ